MSNKPFTILTESWFRYHRLKRRILRIWWKILWRKIYGPMSVFSSLIRWLEELKEGWKTIAYNVNPSLGDIHKTVVVLMWVDTLNYALTLKRKWIIQTVIAWPAISVPIDNNNVFFHKDVDSILVPSQRVKDYFTSLGIENSERIIIWPSWVADTWISNKKNNQIIIYKKTCPEDLYNKICSYLDSIWIIHKTLVYGSFQFQEYQQLLDESVGMIYLQESESQWIALQEARIKDIPTLVRDRWYRTYAWENRRRSTQISCPRMVQEYGMTFNEGNYKNHTQTFIQTLASYEPRKHLVTELTDIWSASLLLELIAKSWNL